MGHHRVRRHGRWLRRVDRVPPTLARREVGAARLPVRHHPGLTAQPLVGLPGRDRPQGARFPALDLGCNLQAGLYAVGFMITFSSLLTKLWRITRIVNNVTVAGKKLISSRMLATFAVTLVASQAIVVVLMWTTAPLYFRLTVERVHGFAVNSYG